LLDLMQIRHWLACNISLCPATASLTAGRQYFWLTEGSLEQRFTGLTYQPAMVDAVTRSHKAALCNAQGLAALNVLPKLAIMQQGMQTGAGMQASAGMQTGEGMQ
ncbi:unnamed protein product, partial [Effrenium voratum]